MNASTRPRQEFSRPKRTCSVCDGGNLSQVLELPEFPLTGIYLDAPDDGQFRLVDQGLNLCGDCGHGQLSQVIDPDYLYIDTYTHRSSLSPISTSGNDFFAAFLAEITGGRTFERIVEVGCNDLYLLKKIAPQGKSLFGIDPIWRGQEGSSDDNITVLGKFVEDVDFNTEIGGAPDLIVSAHTFEHVDEPRHVLANLMDTAADGALFLIEVPCFDRLLANLRFDQVFHQHIHYFSIASFVRLIEVVGGVYLSHRINYDYWGGTLLIAFSKPDGGAGTSDPPIAPAPQETLVRARLEMFKDQMGALMRVIETLKGHRIYGYGGAQMLPTIAYHMDNSLAFLTCVLDDNPDRQNKTYPHPRVWIRKPAHEMNLRESSILITALDSIRPIMKRLLDIRPRHILVPLQVF